MILVIVSCIGIGNTQSAEKDTDAFLVDLSPDQQAELIAKNYLEKNEITVAEEKLIDVIRVSPTSAKAHYWLGIIYFKKNEPRIAVKYFRKSIANDPVGTLARLQLAIALEKIDEVKQAEIVYRFILHLDKKNLQARKNFAEILLARGELSEAIVQFTSILQISPTHQLSVDIRARLEGLHFQYAIELSSELHSKKIQTKAINAIKRWISQKRIKPADRLLLEFLIQYPEHAKANYYYAVLYQLKGKMSLALKYFSRAVEYNKKNIEFLYGYANALMRVNKQQKALKIFKRIVKYADSGVMKKESIKQIGLLEGDVIRQTGNKTALLAHYEKLLNKTPSSLNLLRRLKKIQSGFGMSREAEVTGQRIFQLKNRQNKEKLLIKEARTLISRNQLTDAEYRLRRILQSNPEYSQAFYWLAIVYERKDMFESAVDLIRESISLSGGNASLEKELARLLTLDGRSSEAIEIYLSLADKAKTAGKIKESNALLKLSQFVEGQFYTQNNNVKKARKHYQKMSLEFPKDIFILEALASTYIQLALFEEAEATYLKAVKLDEKRALTYLRLAGLYTQMGLDDKRRKNYQKVLTNDPAGKFGKQALENMLGNAQQALDKQNFEAAFIEYESILAIFPNQTAAMINGVKVAQNIQRLKAAEVLYRRLIYNNPKALYYRVSFARMYIRADDLDSAIREFEKILLIAPSTIEGRESNANLDILYSAKADRIILKLDSDVERKSAVNTARVWLQEKNRIDPAKRVLLAVLEKDEQNEKAHYWIGSIFDRYYLFERAIFHLASSISLAPYNVQLLTAFGRVLARSGNLDSAEALYEKVLAESTGTGLAAVTKKSLGFIVAQRLIESSKPKDALLYYEKMYDDFPGDAALLARIASVQLSLGDLGAANKTFNEVVRLEPNSPSVYLKIAHLYKLQGKEALRKRTLRRVIELDPNGLLGREALDTFGLSDGMEKLREKRWAEAAIIFKHVLTIEPNNSYATLALGSAFLGLTEYEKAGDVFNKILSLDPGNLEARLKLAHVYVSTKKTAFAVLELERVVAASKETKEGKEALVNLTNIYRERGAALLKGGKGDDAVREYRNAIIKDPDDWRAHFILGKLFHEGSRTASIVNRRKFLDLAVLHLSETVRVMPENYDAHLKLGTIYESMQLTDKARDSFVFALSLLKQDNKKLINILINAIRIQVVRREFQKNELLWSLAEIRDMLLLEPNAVRLHLFEGTIHLRLADVESAIISMKRAVKLEPKNITARYRLGQLYEQTNKLDRAADQYRAIIFASNSDNGSSSGTIVDAARERANIVEERLRILTFRLRYSTAAGGSTFNGVAAAKNFSSSIRLDIVANFRPLENIGLSFNASPIYSSFHDSENDSISTTYGFTGNINFENNFFTAVVNQRENSGLLLNVERGQEKNASFSASRRLKIPLLLTENGAISPSTIRLQASTRVFESSDVTLYDIRTLIATALFSHPFQAGGSLSLSYSAADTANLFVFGSDYANRSHSVSLSVSKPIASKLFAYVSGSVTYENYKYIDSIRFAPTTSVANPPVRKRKTGQVSLTSGFNYRLHRKLSLFADFSYIDHRTDIPAERLIYLSSGFAVGLKGSPLNDYQTYRVNTGFQFQF